MTRRQSAFGSLLRQPHRFRFDAALRLLMHRRRTGDPAQAARFRTQPGRAFPGAEIVSVEPDAVPRATVALIGLIGAGGVLPRLYETLAAETARGGSTGLHAFLDLLSHRMVAAFARAGIKYRLDRVAEMASLDRAAHCAGNSGSGGAGRPAVDDGPPIPPIHNLSPPAATGPSPAVDPISRSILALAGYGTRGLLERLEAGPDPVMHYAGLFAMRPRSADRLAALLSDWLDRPVIVQQFAGDWLVLPPDQQTALPRFGQDGAWNQLGVDAAIGERSWDVQGRIVLRIGPLDRRDFEALLPDQPAHRRLAGLVRAFLGLEVGFSINPVLAAEARFALALDAMPLPRLGWNTWATLPEGASRQDAGDAVFGESAAG